MRVNRLFEQEVFNGFNVRAEIDYTDLNDTAGLTKTLALGKAWPASTVVLRAAFKTVVAGVGCAALAVEIGDSGDVDRFLATNSAKAAAGTVVALVPSTAPAPLAGTLKLQALFTATTDNLDQLTAGSWVVYAQVAELGAL
jgi:hypothetical protein